MTAPAKPTHRQQILRHLMVYGSITPREAIEEYRCFRLAARICELRKEGHVIDCDISGGFARYTLAVVPA